MRKIFSDLAWLLFVLIFAVSTDVMAAGREKEWKQVEEAINKGLPRTAIGVLEQIIPGALKDKSYGEAAKAIARKIVLEASIEGSKPEEKITRMQSALSTAPDEIKPILLTLQANWYWQYFQNNRWRFMRRSATAVAPGSDFTTWDLPRLFAEIDKVFSQALSNADVLKKTPISAFDDLLQRGTVPDSYRPTMYDFIAYKALEFYTSGEQAAAKPADAFEITADSPIFSTAREFIKWRPQTTDVTSPKLQAIIIYQSLLAFHQNDKDPSAFAEADLARLVWGWNVAVGDGKSERYKLALKKFIDVWGDHELCAMALYHLAKRVKDEGDFVEARKLVMRGASVFPESHGGRLCKNLVTEIESKSLNISAERVWNKPFPKITVRYRNIDVVHFKVMSLDWAEQVSKGTGFHGWLTDEDQKRILKQKPVLEFEAKLKTHTDYKEHLQKVSLPEELKPGFYCIIASYKPDFGSKDNSLSYHLFWVSELSAVVFSRAGNIEGLVVEAGSGEPIKDVVVSPYRMNEQGKAVKDKINLKTDEDGFFVYSGKTDPFGRGVIFHFKKGEQELATMEWMGSWEPRKTPPREQVMFFTDRALYRPGQTVHFKGILLRIDQENDDYQVIPRRTVTAIFSDPNGKEVARKELVSNDYGSFSGNFTAPADRLMGSYSIRLLSGPPGSVHFNVEEYKRPKFSVTLDPPAEGTRLGDSVRLKGKAIMFTGVAVDGAQVKWRVVRQVRYPPWWDWWFPFRRGVMPSTAAQEIAFGTTQTATDGSFEIQFIAKPDPAVDPQSEASFSFVIYADVTDSSGETRSANRGISVGFTAIQALVDISEWQTTASATEIKITTQTLDGEPQIAEGALKVFRLIEPETPQRPPLQQQFYPREQSDEVADEDEPDMSNPWNWKEGEIVFERGVTTSKEGKLAISQPFKPGCYRVVFETQDRFVKKATARAQFTVLDLEAKKFPIKLPFLLSAPKWNVEPGEEFMALWGTGYAQGRAFVQIEHRNKIIQQYWTPADVTQHKIVQTVTEQMRGGFTLHICFVKENRAFIQSRRIDVPWSNKELELSWEHFTSKLQPAQKETWTLVINPKKVGTADKLLKTAVELAATLYDESLDLFKPHHWVNRFNIFRVDHSTKSGSFVNREDVFNPLPGGFHYTYLPVDIRYREFPQDLIEFYPYFGRYNVRFMRRAEPGLGGREEAVAMAAVPPGAVTKAAAPAMEMEKQAGRAMDAAADRGAAVELVKETPSVDLSNITARKNLNETAFFFPHLIAQPDGVVKLEFTMPEALTRWRFMGFAHDVQCRSGFISASAVTAKDLMVQPNPPRFLREGDVILFPVKVSNKTDQPQKGRLRLNFASALTEENVDKLLGNNSPEISFDVPANESRSYLFKIAVPDGAPFLMYRVVGSTGNLSDGEEGYIPVLSRRIFVTESLPLPIRGEGTKKFRFDSLINSTASKTLKHQALVVQMVSQPVWYAVMALPYLMEYPYECTEQIFNRFYANSLARHIANSDPKIRRIFDLWKATPALDSPLEKNQDLKAVMLEETPWYRAAQNESQARRNVGILFDNNRLNNEMNRAFAKLQQMQLPDGTWSWFPGAPRDYYITLYITTGFGRLRHLGVDVNVSSAIKALNALDGWVDEIYRRILERKIKDECNISETIAMYIYCRSFFLKDKPIAKEHKEAVDYFIAQARKYWLRLPRQSQAHIAIGLHRFNKFNRFDGDTTPGDIIKFLKERAVTNEEMGMFWRDTELSWWWYRAPIETQAMMIEMFDEVAADAKAVDDCKTFLLKQKQTQDWKTTKATADAVYALLLRGSNWLASDKLVEVIVGGINITPATTAAPSGETEKQQAVEPGTGFYEKRFSAGKIKPSLGEIIVKKYDPGVSWGSIHWQYLEDMTKVKPYAGTPLKLKKTIYKKDTTKKGLVLVPVKGALNVGDELVVRIELRVDRDMEYVHLKDQRPSGVEPVNVLSGCRFQDGLVYYETTRDTASHFFIHYMPKGTYVFEYSARVQHKGTFQTGIASIQCMYAPEFNSHSESFLLEVK